MKLIIGLGNPGEKYIETRHNLGWRVIDYLHQNLKLEDWRLAKKFDSLISQRNTNQEKIILSKPQTMMNNSGRAVKALVDYYKISKQDILIVHDEIDLPLGKIKLQQDRSSAGHRGVQSIIDRLGTKDFIRMRIGIAPRIKNQESPKQNKSAAEQVRIKNTERFVLEKFTEQEEEIIQKSIKKAAQIIETAMK